MESCSPGAWVCVSRSPLTACPARPLMRVRHGYLTVVIKKTTPAKSKQLKHCEVAAHMDVLSIEQVRKEAAWMCINR